MQRRLTQTKLHYKSFYSVSEETSHKPSKIVAVENSFPSVYVIGTARFDKCFFIPYYSGKTLFITQIYRYPEIFCNRYGVVYFKAGVLKEVRTFYLFSPQ